MALEPKNVVAGGEEENAELRDMTRRFWIGAALSLPVFVLAMWHFSRRAPGWVQGDLSRWVQFILSTPVVLWAGWPFFERGWQSIRQSLAQYVYADRDRRRRGLFLQRDVMLLPGIFPPSFEAHGKIGVYFEAAAVITVLVLLGQVLEAARAQPDRQRDSRVTRSRAQHGAPRARRRRTRRAARSD